MPTTRKDAGGAGAGAGAAAAEAAETPSQAATGGGAEGKEVVEAPPEPTRVKNLYDSADIKHQLDSVAVEVVQDAGYDEDYLVSNVKITLGVMAIACALYAHFGPGKFPASRSAVAACVLAYGLLTAVLGVFAHFREGDSFLVTLPKPGCDDSGLRVASKMDRHGDGYTLTVSSANKDEDHTAQLETSVANYFHADGLLAEAKWRAHVRRLLSQYERSRAEAPAVRPRAWDVKRLPPVGKQPRRVAAPAGSR